MTSEILAKAFLERHVFPEDAGPLNLSRFWERDAWNRISLEYKSGEHSLFAIVTGQYRCWLLEMWSGDEAIDGYPLRFATAQAAAAFAETEINLRARGEASEDVVFSYDDIALALDGFMLNNDRG